MSSISAFGSLSFSEDSGTIFYQIGSGSPQTVSSWPVTIINTDPSANLQILFTTTLTMTSVNHFFICGSTNIQFGSPSLTQNGSAVYRPTITINTNNYPGLIKNGDGVTSGFNDIYIYNLFVNGDGYTLGFGAGWVCQEGFGNGVTINYITNCVSQGDIQNVGCGGIVGGLTGSSGGTVNIIGCTSSGAIGSGNGGIVGAYAGQTSGIITCLQCWSTGTIDTDGGGIYGSYAGVTGGVAQAVQCYSTGLIGTNAGGIFGRYAGTSGGQVVADRSYSQGNISTNGGGIFGANAGASSILTIARNCYSSGSFVTSGTGIYGSSKAAGATQQNCYAANGSWSDSSANSALQGVPNPTVGTVWISTGTNQPYELNEMGYTPYSLTIINSEDSLLIQSYSQTIEAGQMTVEAVKADASGNAFTIVEITGGSASSYGTFSMNLDRGGISTTSATIPGTYTILVRSVGSYNYTRFLLTVLAQTVGAAGSVPCCAVPIDLTGATYEMRYDFIAGNSMIYQKETNPNFSKKMSYSDMYKLKMAYAAKR